MVQPLRRGYGIQHNQKTTLKTKKGLDKTAMVLWGFQMGVTTLDGLRDEKETATSNAPARRPLEAHVARWWRDGRFKNVVPIQGRVLQVLYPGRPSPSVGSDFRDTLLITKEGDLIRGGVEVHIRQRDWQAHGHHGDSRYNNVVLHLFLQGKSDKTCLQAGPQVPEVLLTSPLHTSTPSSSLLSDAPTLSAPTSFRPNGRHTIAAPVEGLRLLPLKELERALDEAGELRFLRKASAMLERLRRGDA